MRRMENTKKMYVTATEAAELLGVSNGYAYNGIVNICAVFKPTKLCSFS